MTAMVAIVFYFIFYFFCTDMGTCSDLGEIKDGDSLSSRAGVGNLSHSKSNLDPFPPSKEQTGSHKTFFDI